MLQRYNQIFTTFRPFPINGRMQLKIGAANNFPAVPIFEAHGENLCALQRCKEYDIERRKKLYEGKLLLCAFKSINNLEFYLC